MQLCEKYRPGTWEQFVGNDKTVGRLRAIVAREGFGEGAGEALWFSGGSGTGKTTLAHLLRVELDVPKWAYLEIDGESCTVQTVREFDTFTRAAGLWADVWRLTVVNEAHAMTAKAVQAWLTLLERLPEKWLVVFTTTQGTSGLFGDFDEPLMSRCKVFQLTTQGLAQRFADRAREIADAEGLNGKPAAAYLRLVQSCHNNFRAVLQQIDAGVML